MRGWIKHFIISGLLCMPYVAKAQAITCEGTSPDWSLTIDAPQSTFAFDRTSQMQVMQDDVSQNSPTIRALTLVGPRDSAIVILDQSTNSATVLTQRIQSPIILSGTCTYP